MCGGQDVDREHRTIRKADKATEVEHAHVLFADGQGKRSKGGNVSSTFSVVSPDKTHACSASVALSAFLII